MARTPERQWVLTNQGRAALTPALAVPVASPAYLRRVAEQNRAALAADQERKTA